MNNKPITLEFDIKANQILFLWELLFIHKGEPAAKKNLHIDLAVAQRNTLEKHDLIEVYKEGRGLNVVLTEKGWVWCEQNLSLKFNTRSTKVIFILQAQLESLTHYHQSHAINLYDFFNPDTVDDEDSEAVEESESAENTELTEPKNTEKEENVEDIERHSNPIDSPQTHNRHDTVLQAIKSAYFKLTQQRVNERVRLSALKDQLHHHYPLEQLNEQLLAAHRDASSGLTLYPLDMPSQITADDEQAAVYIAGYPFHIVYIEK